MSEGGNRRIVIIGAGQAGGEVAQRLRQGGFEGDITLIGEEAAPPYQRPPLSKKYLMGELDMDRLLLRPASVYAEERVALLLSVRAVWIDRANKRVRLEGGREVPYDTLVLATGAKPRPLPIEGADLPGGHVLRTAAHVDAIRTRFRSGAKLIIVGAGYIGLEVAAVARQRDTEAKCPRLERNETSGAWPSGWFRCEACARNGSWRASSECASRT